MFGASTFAETAFSNTVGVVQAATSEMSGLASSSSIGSGILVGVSSINGNFTQTTAGIYITGSVNAEVSSNFIETSIGRRVKEATSEQTGEFAQTTNSIMIASGISSQNLNFTKTSSGDILYIAIVPEANESYNTITPSGAETWTEITPSGTETYTEIEA